MKSAKKVKEIILKKNSVIIKFIANFDYKKEEDLEYQEYLRECEEVRANHVDPIHYDEN